MIAENVKRDNKMSEEVDPNKIASVKYYALTNENARSFFDEWYLKTMAIINKKGWSAPFDDPTAEIPSAADVARADATEKSKSLYKANNEAYDQILMGCSGIPLGLVKRAKGNARKAMEALKKKYSMKDESNLTEMLNLFVQCKLKDTTTDPDSWFLELDQINDKLEGIDAKYRKEEFELKAHLLGNLPEGYNDVKTKISGREKDYEVEDIEDEIRRKWKREFETNEEEMKNKKQLALPVVQKKGWKLFKGKC